MNGFRLHVVMFSWCCRYAAVGLMHIPCFGIFALIVKLKHLWLSRCYSEGT